MIDPNAFSTYSENGQYYFINRASEREYFPKTEEGLSSLTKRRQEEYPLRKTHG